MAGLRVSRRNFGGFLTSFAAICEDFCVFAKILTRSVVISRPAPENLLALVYVKNFRASIDTFNYALYNISYELQKQTQTIQAKRELEKV